MFVWACHVQTRSEYSIVHINAGPAVLDDVAVKYGTFESLCGVLVPNAEKVHGGVTAPVPNAVNVVWRTQDGKQHAKTVAVEGARPFRQLIVTIHGDEVSAVLK